MVEIILGCVSFILLITLLIATPIIMKKRSNKELDKLIEKHGDIVEVDLATSCFSEFDYCEHVKKYSIKSMENNTVSIKCVSGTNISYMVNDTRYDDISFIKLIFKDKSERILIGGN